MIVQDENWQKWEVHAHNEREFLLRMFQKHPISELAIEFGCEPYDDNFVGWDYWNESPMT